MTTATPTAPTTTPKRKHLEKLMSGRGKDKPAVTPTSDPPPIIATAPVLPPGISPDDVKKVKELAGKLVEARRSDKSICRQLGEVWNRMKTGWSGEGSCARWIGGQFGFAERTVYLYQDLADKWAAYHDYWKQKLPHLDPDAATINELIGLFTGKWSPEVEEDKKKGGKKKGSSSNEVKLDNVRRILAGYAKKNLIELKNVAPGQKVKGFSMSDRPVIYWPGVEPVSGVEG